MFPAVPNWNDFHPSVNFNSVKCETFLRRSTKSIPSPHTPFKQEIICCWQPLKGSWSWFRSSTEDKHPFSINWPQTRYVKGHASIVWSFYSSLLIGVCFDWFRLEWELMYLTYTSTRWRRVLVLVVCYLTGKCFHFRTSIPAQHTGRLDGLKFIYHTEAWLCVEQSIALNSIWFMVFLCLHGFGWKVQ